MGKNDTKIKADENAELKFKPGELREMILGLLGASLVLGGSIAFPNLPIVIGFFIKLARDLKNIKLPKQKLERVLKNLEKKQIISLVRKNDQVYVRIKDKFNISILKYSLKELLVFKKKEKQWKGKWYMVIFDIPEQERNKRNYLRRLLRELGFYQYQQSVYIFPYECEEEIKLIKKITESNKYISYIVAEKIEKEKEAKIFFNLL